MDFELVEFGFIRVYRYRFQVVIRVSLKFVFIRVRIFGLFNILGMINVLQNNLFFFVFQKERSVRVNLLIYLFKCIVRCQQLKVFGVKVLIDAEVFN